MPIINRIKIRVNKMIFMQFDEQKTPKVTLLGFFVIKLFITYLCVFSSDTVNFFLPLALRDANTLRPLALAILSRKPCLFFLFFTDG